MALTSELLKANAALSSLTEEQINAVVQMSLNDEQSVIGQKTGEIYGGLDADILEVSGIAKNGTEKTYDYAKRVIGEIKAKAGDSAQMQSQIAELTKEKTRLESELAKGGDAETKRLLTQAKADLANVTKEYTELQKKYTDSESNHAKELMGVRMESEFARATNGVNFKKDLPKTVTDVLLQQAVDKVKAMNPEYIDDGSGKGTKVLAFKDSTGAVMRNPKTNLNPYTANELVLKELEGMQVLDNGRQQTGTGSQGGMSGGDGATIDIGGAPTQSEAQSIIARSLASQGLVKGSNEYEAKMKEAWSANKDVIKTLPIQ